MPTNLEYIEANVNFDDSIYSGKYILLPTEIGNIRKRYNTTYNNTRNSSDSDFSHARLNKRRRYSSNKWIARTATNMRVHNKNNNKTKSGKKKDKITNNNIECTVRKYSTRKVLVCFLRNYKIRSLKPTARLDLVLHHTQQRIPLPRTRK